MFDKLSVAVASGKGEFPRWIQKILALLAMASTFFTFKGASIGADTFDETAAASVFAIASGIAIYAFWIFVFRSVLEWETRKDKVRGLSIVTVGLLFIIALSSTYNVVGIDKGAVLTHHQALYIDSLALEMADILEANNELEGKEAEIRQNKSRYGTLAENELKGSVSGTGGKGAVYHALLGTAGRLNGLLGEINSFQITADAAAKAARTRLERMRAIQSSSRSFVARDRMIKTESDLLRADFVEMDSKALNDGVSRTISGLAGESDLVSSFSRDKGTEQLQREAIERLQDEISKTATSLDNAFAQNVDEDEGFPAYRPISPTRAVLKYWPQIIPQWSGGIALDTTPLALLAFVLLSLGARPREETERKRVLHGTSAADLLEIIMIWDALKDDKPSTELSKLFRDTLINGFKKD